MRKLMRPLVILIYILAMGYAAITGVTQPYCNWDMLGYTASVISWTQSSHQVVYDKTMATVRAHTPAEWVQQFAENPLSAEADAFHEQLPLYQVKPLYTGLMWLVHQFGIDLPVASWIVSSASILGLAVIIFLWKPRYQNYSFWLLTILALAYLFPFNMGELSRSSTPDALCTFLITGMFFSWLYLRSFTGFAIFAFLAQLARPDALLMSAGFAMYFAIFPPEGLRMDKIKAICLCVLLTATYLIVSKLAHNYGLERWFLYAFVDKTPYPAEATDHLTLAKYWEILAPSTVLFFERPRNIMMMVWTMLSFIFYFMKPAPGNKQNFHIILLSWAALIVRFLMFPGWGEDRYYYVYYVIILYAGGELMAPYFTALCRILAQAQQKIQQTEV